MPRVLSDSDAKYLETLKRVRLEILESGVSSYKVGGRAVTRLDLPFIVKEIEKLEGSTAPRFRRIVVRDR